MKPRTLTQPIIQDYLNKFNPTSQYEILKIGNTIKPDIENFRKEFVENDFTFHDNVTSDEAREILFRVAEYAAYYERDDEVAREYLNKVEPLLHTVQHRLRYLKLQAYIYPIDPTACDEKIYKTILAHEQLSIANQDPHTADLKIMAMQYQALMLHRQAMQVANNSEKSEMLSLGAISWIDAAIRLCRSPFTKNREALLSETLHLKGVMNLQVAKFYYFDKKIKTIDQAKKLFDEALEQQEKFCKKTVTTPYFMQATTLQSLSKIFLENKQFDEAILCLSNALNIQKTIFGKDRPHKDIAKTLHFLGDAFLAKGDVEKAAKNYLMALVMKAKINYNQKDMVTVTQDALVKSLAAITDTEKKSALQQKIWQEFSDPVNVKQFINSVDTLKKLREKILPDVKLHSVQAADKQQHRLFAKKSISLAEPIPSVRFGKK